MLMLKKRRQTSSLILAWLWLALPAWSAEAFNADDVQVVRSVLERQNTLLHLNQLVAARLESESVKQIVDSGSKLLMQQHAQLLAVAKQAGMTGIENLSAPPYFERVTTQWQSLTGVALTRQYLLVALQCQAFIGRSLSAELRSGDSAAVQAWIKDNIDALDAATRELDHALYDLRD